MSNTRELYGKGRKAERRGEDGVFAVAYEKIRKRSSMTTGRFVAM